MRVAELFFVENKTFTRTVFILHEIYRSIYMWDYIDCLLLQIDAILRLIFKFNDQDWRLVGHGGPGPDGQDMGLEIKVVDLVLYITICPRSIVTHFI